MAEILEGFLVVGATVAISLIGLRGAQRWLPIARLRDQNEIAGYIYAVIAVIYGVPLAFVLVAAWDQFDETRTVIAREANDLMDLYGAVGVLDEPTRDRVRERVVAYAVATIEEEWSTMEIGEASPAVEAELAEIWNALQEAELDGPTQEAWYGEALGRLNDLTDSRQMRVLSSQDELPSALWIMLIAGAVVTIVFSFLFGAHDVLAQDVMVALLAGLIALVLYLIAGLEHPYSGAIQLEARAFEQFVQSIDATGPF